MGATMNIPMALALVIIAVGIFGLVGMLVYAQVNRPSVKRPSVKRSNRNTDLVVVHRVGPRKKRRVMRPVAAAPVSAVESAPDDDSRWRRPGFAAATTAPNERQPLPYYEPDKPRHVFIAHTPSVIIPHQTVEPERKPRLSQRTQRSQPTAMIKTVRVETQKPA